jgi:hypothetical protein
MRSRAQACSFLNRFNAKNHPSGVLEGWRQFVTLRASATRSSVGGWKERVAHIKAAFELKGETICSAREDMGLFAGTGHESGLFVSTPEKLETENK